MFLLLLLSVSLSRDGQSVCSGKPIARQRVTPQRGVDSIAGGLSARTAVNSFVLGQKTSFTPRGKSRAECDTVHHASLWLCVCGSVARSDIPSFSAGVAGNAFLYLYFIFIILFSIPRRDFSIPGSFSKSGHYFVTLHILYLL